MIGAGMFQRAAIAPTAGAFDHTGNYVQGTIGARLSDAQVCVTDFPWLAKANDNTVDNAAAITAALRWVAAQGGGTVRVPKGQFRTTTRIGTDPANNADTLDHVTLESADRAVLYFDTAASDAAICLEGNDVAVRGLRLWSNRTIHYDQDLTAQRAIYQSGIVVGGKNYQQSPRSNGSVADFRTGALVEGCEVLDFNAPITVFRAASYTVRDCTVQRYTDTGILVDDCTTDGELCQNTVTLGGDDCIYARHYLNSPWVTAGKYIGGLEVWGNTLSYTFGKCFGVAGYSDWQFIHNDTDMSFAGNVQFGQGGGSYVGNQANGLIAFNKIRRGGRLWGTAQPVAAHQVPLGQQASAGIQSVSENSRNGSQYTNIRIFGNDIINPYQNGVAVNGADSVRVYENEIVAGGMDHGAGVVYSTGVGVYVAAANDVKVKRNSIRGIGANFAYAYHLSSTDGSAYLQDVTVFDNDEHYTTGVFTADTDAAALNVTKYRAQNAGDSTGVVRSDGTADRYSFIGTGGGSNLQVYHKAGWPARVFNSSGTGLLLGVDSAGAAQANVGVGVGGTPQRRLHVTGPANAPALRLDNSNVANSNVATVLGSVGPAGSHTTVQGWIQIDIGGTVGYVPYW